MVGWTVDLGWVERLDAEGVVRVGRGGKQLALDVETSMVCMAVYECMV